MPEHPRLVERAVMRVPSRVERGRHLVATTLMVVAASIAWFIPLAPIVLFSLVSVGKVQTFIGPCTSCGSVVGPVPGFRTDWAVVVGADPSVEEVVATSAMLVVIVLLVSLTVSALGRRVVTDRSRSVYYVTSSGHRAGRVRTVLRVLLPVTVFVALSMLVGAVVAFLVFAVVTLATVLVLPSRQSPVDVLLGVRPMVFTRVIPSRQKDLDWRPAPPALEEVGLRAYSEKYG